MISTAFTPPVSRVRGPFAWLPLARCSFVSAALVTLLAAAAVHAEPAPFDLAGPNLVITVTRGQKTLPITQVPNLAPGDRLWIQADFPATQSAHY